MTKIDPQFLEVLACPDCKASLIEDDKTEELVCVRCGLGYPIEDGVPVLLIERASAKKD